MIVWILMNLTLGAQVGADFTGVDAQSACSAALQAKVMDRTNRYTFQCVEKK